jgi:S1-C subfamily serine protease
MNGMRQKMGRVTLLMLTLIALVACDMLPRQQPTVAPTPIILVVTPTPLPPEVVLAAAADEQVLIDMYARVSPAVVHITSRVIVRNFFYGEVPQEGTGSGFVIDTQGHIITNNHVVENAEKVTVTLSDDTAADATVVGTDPSTDVAVLKIDVSSDKLHPVELGTSANLRVGQRAIAIGNPFGFDRTLTTGVIRSLGRPLETENGRTIYDVIQTDAAINPGNSGGPLLDSNGRVIGVNSAIYSPSGGSVGVGFAIPIDTVRRVATSIIEKGYFPHPSLGITGLSITADLARYLQLPVERGVLVIEATAGQAAAKAGIRGGSRQVRIGSYRVPVGGDILTGIDDNKILGMEDVVKYLETKAKVGQTVSLTIVRDGKEQTVQAQVEEQPRNG